MLAADTPPPSNQHRATRNEIRGSSRMQSPLANSTEQFGAKRGGGGGGEARLDAGHVQADEDGRGEPMSPEGL